MTQPITTDADRLRAIAAIHAFAEWLTNNPDVPCPTEIAAHAHATHVQEVHDFAAARCLEVQAPTDTTRPTRWANIQTASRFAQGINIRYIRIGS